MEFYVSQGTFWGIFSGKTLYNFYSFQTVSKKHSHFPQKTPAGSSELPSTSPGECFEVLFGEIYLLFITFALCAEKQIHFWRKLFASIVQMLRVLRNVLGRNIFFDKTKTMFFRLPHFERNFLGLLTETFQQVCQNRSLRLQRKILTIFFCKMNILFIIFVFNPQNSFQLFSKCLASLSKMQIGCSGDNLRASDFWRNTNDFHHFRTMNENISNLWRKKFRHGCQNWLLRVQRNLWWSFFAKFKIHLIIFGIWVKYC